MTSSLRGLNAASVRHDENERKLPTAYAYSFQDNGAIRTKTMFKMRIHS